MIFKNCLNSFVLSATKADNSWLHVRHFNLLILVAGLLISINVYAQDVNIDLHAETWDIPRHGEALLKVPELSSIMQKWMRDPQQKIELRYPGGEEGELWVEELKDWFVSLGVPSKAIQVSPGSNAQDVINMVLIETVK